MMHSSPLHRPPPAVAITSWSELSYALQPVSPSQAHGRTSHAASSSSSGSASRPRQLSTASQNTQRYNPYASRTQPRPTSSVFITTETASKSKGPVTCELAAMIGLRDAKEEEKQHRNHQERLYKDPSLPTSRGHRVDPVSSKFSMTPAKRSPVFPHVVEFEELPARSGSTPKLGIYLVDVLEGKTALLGESDRLMKYYPDKMLLLKVPMQGTRGGRGQMSWDVEVGTDEGRITRIRLLQAAARAIMSCCFTDHIGNKPDKLRALQGMRINAIKYQQGQGIWLLDFGF